MAQQDTQAAGSGIDQAEALLNAARELVVKDRKASISYVQRKLKVGYNAAATLLDLLEREGVVSPIGRDFTRSVIAPAATNQVAAVA